MPGASGERRILGPAPPLRPVPLGEGEPRGDVAQGRVHRGQRGLVLGGQGLVGARVLDLVVGGRWREEPARDQRGLPVREVGQGPDRPGERAQQREGRALGAPHLVVVDQAVVGDLLEHVRGATPGREPVDGVTDVRGGRTVGRRPLHPQRHGVQEAARGRRVGGGLDGGVQPQRVQRVGQHRARALAGRRGEHVPQVDEVAAAPRPLRVQRVDLHHPAPRARDLREPRRRHQHRGLRVPAAQVVVADGQVGGGGRVERGDRPDGAVLEGQLPGGGELEVGGGDDRRRQATAPAAGVEGGPDGLGGRGVHVEGGEHVDDDVGVDVDGAVARVAVAGRDPVGRGELGEVVLDGGHRCSSGSCGGGTASQGAHRPRRRRAEFLSRGVGAGRGRAGRARRRAGRRRPRRTSGAGARSRAPRSGSV